MTKFILVVPNGNVGLQKLVCAHFSPGRAAWWHWSSEVWLLSFPTENPTAEALRSEIAGLLPGVVFLVFKIPQGAEWAGWGTQEWQTWLNQYWP